MRKLIEKFLDVVEVVFDKCIIYSLYFLFYEEFFVIFNLVYLDFEFDCYSYFGLVCMVKD